MKFSSIVKVLAVCLVILTCIISVKSLSGSITKSAMNKENFVNIYISGYAPCDLGEADTGECFLKEEKIDILSASASGLVLGFDRDIKKTKIITAYHFCDSFLNPYLSKLLSMEMTVTDVNSNTYPATIVKYNKQYDLCLLTIDSSVPGSKTITFENKIPEIGEKVEAIASPLGMSSDGILLTFEGMFSGCDSSGICFYTIPATSGSSGSVVFNKKGKAIGMIQAVPREFDSVSLGVSGGVINYFLND